MNYTKLFRLPKLIGHRCCPIEIHNRVIRDKGVKKYRQVNKYNKGLSAMSRTQEAIISVLRSSMGDTIFQACKSLAL